MSTSNVLHFPDRNLLKLIEAVNGVLRDDGASAPKALELAETVLRDMGAVKDENGKWQMPPDQPGEKHVP